MTRPVLLGGGLALALTALPSITLAQTPKDRLRQLEDRLQAVEAELQAYKQAAAATAPAKPGVSPEMKPSPRFASEDGNFTFRLRGRAEIDFAAFHVRQGTRDFNNGTQVRRARLGIDGTMFRDWAYRLEADFAGASRDDSTTDEIDIKDVFIRYAPKGARYALTAGQHKTPNGLEQLQSSPDLTFLERSTASGSFLDKTGSGGDYKLGLSYAYQGSNWTAALGLFGQNLSVTGNPVGATPVPDESFGVHARLTYAPLQQKTRWVHLGLSGYYRDTVGQKQIRLRDRPEVRIDNARLVDTGTLSADSYAFVGGEAAAAFGPVSIQGEYQKLWADRTAGGTVDFAGGYVAVAYVLTGETVGYKDGVVRGIKPKRDFSAAGGGWGAWQIAARYSFVDLNDLDVLGGQEDNVTVALNWWINPNMRASFNWVRFDARRQGSKTAGDAFAVRVGVVW
jgi:phosphate-selective porin OprO/OprP